MNQRKKLEQLCRYITRPAIANERFKLNSIGDVLLQLKSPHQGSATHIVMSLLECMQRLAALVPRPRINLIRYNGVLAPNAKIRFKITRSGAVHSSDTLENPGHMLHQSRPARISWARLLKRVFDIDHCPNCGGTLKIIAAIKDPAVIARILAHLGLSTRAPPRQLRCPATRVAQPVRSCTGVHAS